MTHNDRANIASARRSRISTAVVLAVTLGSIVLAALQPPWLTAPLHALVNGSGALAPLVFVLLCVLAAPAHLTGVLAALAVLVWPVPVAFALTYAGGMVGAVLTAAVLAWLGAGRVARRGGWPSWLERLARGVDRRPLLVAVGVRFLLQTGLAVEAFFLVLGYRRRTYLVGLALGYAAALVQTFAGVLVVGVAVAVSPWLVGVLIVVPVAAAAVGVVIYRRRSARMLR